MFLAEHLNSEVKKTHHHRTHTKNPPHTKELKLVLIKLFHYLPCFSPLDCNETAQDFLSSAQDG